MALDASDVDSQAQALAQGCSEMVPPGALAARLAAARQARRPLRVKLGCDPTAADLHLGHTVVMQKLAHFQRLGHQAVFIVGDATALIGDPSGRNRQRPALSPAEVGAHAATYVQQCAQVLDIERTEVRHNSQWLSPLGLAEVVSLLSRYNLGRMLERRDFRARLDGGRPLGMHELIYPLLQGYDSVVVAADVELGGHDQIFNLNVGRHLMESHGLAPQVAMTVQLLVGVDGHDKMSKSAGNHIGVREPPAQMFAKTMSISDPTMAAWYPLLLGRPMPGEDGPLAAKKALAGSLVARFHGREQADAARAWWDAGRPVAEDQAPFALTEPVTLQQAVLAVGAATSGREARRKIEQGGVWLDDAREIAPGRLLVAGRHQLRVGKTRTCLVDVGGPPDSGAGRA